MTLSQGAPSIPYHSVAQGRDVGVTWTQQAVGGQPSEGIGRRLVMNGPLGRLV